MLNNKPVLIKLAHLDPDLLERLAWFQQQPGCNWTITPSGEEALPELTITRHGVFMTDGAKQLPFHPSMALIRMMNLLGGRTDRYLEATQLKAGDTLLDATLGLGTEALIGAWAVGENGRVVGLEQSPVLAAFVQDGLNHFAELIPDARNKQKLDAWVALASASPRIEVHWGEHCEYLKRLPSRSVNVVYFDPMFRNTCYRSDSMEPLHRWSDHNPLNHEAILEACRVAQNRVVLKERKDSREFQRLGFEVLSGGQYSKVDYGVILV